MSTARRKTSKADKKSSKKSGKKTGAASKTASTKRPARASQAAREPAAELVFGVLELPAPVMDGGDSVHLKVLTFVDVTDGHALSGPLCREPTPELVRQAWHDALTELSGMGRLPPRRARAASEALATMLREVAGPSLTVEVAATPELDRVQRAMSAMRPGQQLPPSYFHGQSFPSELIRQFFAAALGFRDVEPWLMFGAEEWLDLDIPQLGIEGAAVSIVTDEGCGGLQIFPDHGARERFTANDPTSPPAGGVLAVMFYTRRQLPAPLREELRRMAFAPALGMIPALAVRDEYALPRPLSRRDYLIAIATLEAVAALVEALAQREDADAPAAFEHTATAHGESVTVRLRLPTVRTVVVDEAPALGPGVVGRGSRPAENSVHVLKVTLHGSRPPIWRRLEVRSTITLADLHGVLQVAMGWQDEHLHMFNVKGQEIGPIEHDAEYDERATELWAVAPAARAKLRYTYDFGDDWVHDIEVEAVYAAEQPLAAPRCIDGRRAGPPEDCGGMWGLGRLLAGESLSDFDDDDYDDDFEEADADEDIEEGPRYDPAAFSIDAVNKQLARRYLSTSAAPAAVTDESAER